MELNVDVLAKLKKPLVKKLTRDDWERIGQRGAALIKQRIQKTGTDADGKKYAPYSQRYLDQLSRLKIYGGHRNRG